MPIHLHFNILIATVSSHEFNLCYIIVKFLFADLHKQSYGLHKNQMKIKHAIAASRDIACVTNSSFLRIQACYMSKVY